MQIDRLEENLQLVTEEYHRARGSGNFILLVINILFCLLRYILMRKNLQFFLLRYIQIAVYVLISILNTLTIDFFFFLTRSSFLQSTRSCVYFSQLLYWGLDWLIIENNLYWLLWLWYAIFHVLFSLFNLVLRLRNLWLRNTIIRKIL